MKSLILKSLGVGILLAIFLVGALNGGFSYKTNNHTHYSNQTLNDDVRTSEVDNTTSAILSEQDAINLALSDPEVSAYANDNNADIYTFYDGYSMWYIDLFPQNDQNTWMEVIIDGNQAVILSVDIYSFDEYNGDVNTELENASILYLEENEYTSDFFTNHPDAELMFNDYYGLLNVFAYDITSDDWMSVDLPYDDNMNFDLLDVSSDILFGNPLHTFDDAVDIALQDPLVANFTSSTNYTIDATLSYFNEDYSMYEGMDLYMGYYLTIVFSSMDIFYDVYSEPGESYISVTIEDATGDIIYIDNYYDSNLSEDEVISIALNIPEISEFANNESVEVSAYFDGYEYWDVYLYNYDTGDFADVIIDDITGDVVDYYIYRQIDATLTENEALSILLSDDSVNNWTLSVDNYSYSIYYDNYGYWYISLYDTNNYYNYVDAVIDDQSRSIVYLDIYLAAPAKLDESTVLDLAMSNGLEDFMNQYPDALYQIYYDGFGQWTVSAYDEILVDAWIYIVIDDNTTEIIYSERNDPDVLPTMSVDDVFTLVHESSNYTDFVNMYGDVNETIYFMDGYWYCDVYTYSADNYAGMTFVIDDSTGTITDIYNWEWMVDIGEIP